ncbi:MAG: hypothetical protein WC868_11230 [Bacteroidales bacterium]
MKNFGLLKHLSSFCFFIATLFFILSCNDNSDNSVDCSTYNYSDCNTREPFDGKLYINLSINSGNPAVPITIYKGKLEDNDVILKDTVTTDKYDTLLPIDNYYTVTAKYKKGNTVIVAVDGDKISKSKSKTCDSTCWSVKTASVNVKLK